MMCKLKRQHSQIVSPYTEDHGIGCIPAMVFETMTYNRNKKTTFPTGVCLLAMSSREADLFVADAFNCLFPPTSNAP